MIETSSYSRTSATLLAGLLDPSNYRAWEMLFECYKPILTSFAHRCGFQAADVDDVVQETLLAFLVAYRANQYDSARGRFRDWLRGIARNRVLQLLEKRKLGAAQGVGGSQTETWSDIADSGAGTDELWNREWEQFILRECRASAERYFDPKTLQIFDSYAMKGCTPEETAEKFGVTVNAVYVAKSKVLELMRERARDLELEELGQLAA